LVQSARDYQITHPFVVMVVDPDGLPPSHANFSKLPLEAEVTYCIDPLLHCTYQPYQNAFKRLQADVRYIEQVPVPAHARFGNPRWAIAWNKLQAYLFTEYDKIVFLDSGM
jgi:hypothetical protein